MAKKLVGIRLADDVEQKLRELTKELGTYNDTIKLLIERYEKGKIEFILSENVMFLLKKFIEQNGDIEIDIALNYIILKFLITKVRVGKKLPNSTILEMWKELKSYEKEMINAIARRNEEQKEDEIVQAM